MGRVSYRDTYIYKYGETSSFLPMKFLYVRDLQYIFDIRAVVL